MTIPRAPITGGSRKLPSSLTRKLTQRGDYDPEIAANRKVKAAAANLRVLIETTYGDDAEDVLCQVRRMVSDAGALDGDSVVGRNAEAMIYTKIAARIGAGTFEVGEWGRIDLISATVE